MSRGEVWWYEEPGAKRRPCLILTRNVRPITASFCTERITVLDPERMARVCEALSAATGCRPRLM